MCRNLVNSLNLVQMLNNKKKIVKNIFCAILKFACKTKSLSIWSKSGLKDSCI